MGYEVNFYETRDIIEALLNETTNPKTTYFGTYDEAKTRISLEIEIPQVLKRGKKRMETLKKKLKGDPLMLTKGKGEDEEEEEGEEKEE